MTTRRLLDRSVLLVCASLVAVGAAWLAFRPAAAGVMLLAIAGLVCAWRARSTFTRRALLV